MTLTESGRVSWVTHGPSTRSPGEASITWWSGRRTHAAAATDRGRAGRRLSAHRRKQGRGDPDATKQVKQLDRVIIRFAGDSGDGMQLTGDRFTQETAAFGNDLVTLPNFPAEIRAPQGTLPGVSSFQVHFADHDILTAGDAPDVLVAMNPAALRANLGDLPKGATIIVDTHDFTARNLTKAGYTDQPARGRHAWPSTPLHTVDLTGMTVEAVKEFGLSRKDAARAKNMFALGLLSWMYGRPTEPTIAFLDQAVRQGARHPRRQHHRVQGRLELRRDHRGVRRPATRSSRPPMPPGTYRNITGNLALAYGLDRRRRAVRAPGVPRLLPDHPGLRHPARAVASTRRFGVTTFQAEDEIAGVGAAIGAVVRRPASASPPPPGPGVALKSEAIGLAVMTELPLVVIDVQRGGPSTGLPTKTEQADLLQAMFGRNGEAPVPIVAPQSPGDCFDAAVEATRIADHLPHAGDAALRRLPRQRLRAVADPGRRRPARRSTPTSPPRPRTTARATTPSSGPTCATTRPWPARGRSPARPASSTASAASRRATGTATSPTTRPTTTSWSAPARPRSTGSPTRCRRSRSTTPSGDGQGAGPRLGLDVRPDRRRRTPRAQGRLPRRPGAPAPPQPVPQATSATILKRYDKVLVPEMNLGQLSLLLRAKYLVDVVGYNQVRGLPLKAAELADAIGDLVGRRPRASTVDLDVRGEPPRRRTS